MYVTASNVCKEVYFQLLKTCFYCKMLKLNPEQYFEERIDFLEMEKEETDI